MTKRLTQWGIAPLTLAALVAAGATYECWIADTAVACTTAQVGSACQGKCPNCPNQTLTGTVDNQGERQIVKTAPPGYTGREKTSSAGRCTYSCKLTAKCPVCGGKDNIVDILGDYDSVVPGDWSNECTGK
jgi:hypothetical protein